jgi:hypothetical protein
MPARPPRTDAHRQRDAYLQQFAALGLTPILSTNGSNPEADIQVVKGEKPGDVPECWITAKGQARLERAQVQQAGDDL